MNKEELRQEFRRRRRNITPPLRKAYSRTIANKALQLAESIRAKTVFVYLSVGAEVETHELTEELLRRKIRVAVPRCQTESHTMDAVAIADITDLEPGTYGILEPKGTAVIPPEAIDLILVPGVAFDRDGFRLGQGGGYYDRYLARYGGLAVGLCFAECVTEHLPHGVYDQAVQRVLTEREEV